MNIAQAFQSYWNNYANFSGRSPRSAYWWMYLINVIISILIYIPILNWFIIIYELATIIPDLSVFDRRCHDAGHTGFIWLFGLIPIVGWIILIVLLCQPSVGTYQPYGYNPNNQNYNNNGNNYRN